MCLLIFKPAGKRIPVSHLINAADANPHGAGIACAKNGRLHVLKSPKWSGEEIAEELYSLVDYPAIVHFRLATHGSKNAVNTHPFLASPTVAFAHNGVLYGYGDDKRDVSDTRDFMEREVSPLLEKGIGLKSRAFRRHARKWEKAIGYNKFVLLNAKGDSLIVRESLGLWREGVWYSNDSFLPYVERYTFKSRKSRKGKEAGSFGLSGRDFDWYVEEEEEIDKCEACLEMTGVKFHYTTGLYLCADCESHYTAFYT